jgi:hypothetical protein
MDQRGGPPNDAAVDRARAVLKRERDRLLRQYDGTGVAVSSDARGAPVIVVYLPPGRPLLEREELDGFPLEFRTMAPKLM